MAIPVSAAFTTAQGAKKSGVRATLEAILRNVAASAEDSVAAATDEFSADFPAAGAIDGQAAHLNYGPAATADDGIGKAGWKSASAGQITTKTTAADFNGGIQSSVKTIGNAVELAFTTPVYEQDFNGLTLGTLIGQDGWSSVSGAGTIEVTATGAGVYDGQAVHMTGGDRVARKTFGSLGTGTRNIIFRFRSETAVAANTFFRFDVVATATSRFAVRVFGNTGILQAGVAGSEVAVFNKQLLNLATHYQLSITWTGPDATATVRVFLDGDEVYQATHDMTGVDGCELEADEVGGTFDYYVDELRVASSALQMSGTQDNVIDLGAAPVSARAELSFSGQNLASSAFVTGAFYDLNNNDTSSAINSGATNALRAQTFQLSGFQQIDAAVVELLRTATAPVGNVWCELRTTLAGVPTATVLARSLPIPASTIGTAAAPFRFTFPRPYVTYSGITYALVVAVDYPAGANNVSLRTDTSAPSYASGQEFRFDSGLALWVVEATDAGFILFAASSIETFYDVANQSTELELVRNASNHYLAQGLKVALDADVMDLQIFIRQPALAAYSAGDRWWAEIQSDDGAGKPSNTTIARTTLYDPALAAANATGLQLWSLSFDTLPRLLRGVQYHLVLKANWTGSATRTLLVGADNTAPTYPDGVGTVSTSAATPVWSTNGTDLVFAVIVDRRSFLRMDVAFSDDDITYTAFQRVIENPARASSLGPVTFTGQLKRYWKIRAEFVGRGGVTPVLLSDTLKVVFKTGKVLTVTLPTAKKVDRFELWGHPTEAGFRSIKFETSVDGIAYADVTAALVDAAKIESRRQGGGATASIAGSVFTTTGDYLGFHLLATQTTKSFRMTITDNVDEFARVMEVRAMRVVDFTDRMISPKVKHETDFVLRKVRARVLTLSLRNSDRALTKRGTSDFADQLGSGMRLILRTGYDDATDLVNHGIYYVQRWPDDSKDIAINVQAQDLVWKMNRTVRVLYKQNRRADQLIEYLANLCDIPSTDVMLDQTATRLTHYSPNNPRAYDEMQKLAESAGFSQLMVTEAGYLELRVTANTGRDTNLQASVSPIHSVQGPPVQLDGKIYTLAVQNALTTFPATLVEYDPSTGLNANRGTFNLNGSATQGPNRAFLQVFNGKLFILVARSLSTATGGNELRRWEPASNTFTLLKIVTEYGNEWPTVGNPAQVIPIAIEGSRWWIATKLSGETFIREIDLVNMTARTISTGLTNLAGIGGIVNESGEWWIVYTKFLVLTVAQTWVAKWNTLTDTFTDTVKITDESPFVVTVSVLGATATGAGYIYASVATGSGGNTVPTRTSLWKVTLPGGVVTEFRLMEDSPQGANSSDAAAFIDNLVVVSYGRKFQTGAVPVIGLPPLHMVFDERIGFPVDAGQISLGIQSSRYFRAYMLSFGRRFYLIFDDLRMVEIAPRGSVARQETPQFTLDGNPGGILVRTKIDDADESAGDSRIINAAVVKSGPLIAGATTVGTGNPLWQASSLPWAVAASQQVRVNSELRTPFLVPATPSTALTVTFSGASGTKNLSNHSTQPLVSVDITTGGLITDVRIDGQPLLPASKTIVIAFGSRKSRERFGTQEFTIDNDYINDVATLSLIASWVIARFSEPKGYVRSALCVGILNVQIFDRVTLTDPELGITAKDFYVTSLDHDLKGWSTSLGLVEV